MLVSKNAKVCITPNANPQREQVEYRSRCKMFVLAMYISFFCVNFIRVGYHFSVEYGLDFSLTIYSKKTEKILYNAHQPPTSFTGNGTRGYFPCYP